MIGHWYCEKCEEVVFRYGKEPGMNLCPQCHTMNARFIIHVETPQTKALNAELAALLFKQMKESIK